MINIKKNTKLCNIKKVFIHKKLKYSNFNTKYVTF